MDQKLEPHQREENCNGKPEQGAMDDFEFGRDKLKIGDGIQKLIPSLPWFSEEALLQGIGASALRRQRNLKILQNFSNKNLIF